MRRTRFRSRGAFVLQCLSKLQPARFPMRMLPMPRPLIARRTLLSFFCGTLFHLTSWEAIMRSSTRAVSLLIELLEPRRLLSAQAAGSPDTAFGDQGVLEGYEVLAANDDGSLIAENSSQRPMVLHPDGTF